MLDLKALTKPLAAPPELTVGGTAGSGKTSLGAKFPAPIIMQAETSGALFETWDEEDRPMPLPKLQRARRDGNKNLISTLDQALDQLRALLTQDHPYKTLVVDTVTSLDTLFQHELCVKDGVENVAEAQGGYGKGYLTVKQMHLRFKTACEALRDRKGMAIVYLAHVGVQKMKDRPDTDEYTIFNLDMHKESIPVYTNLVDAVLYLRQEEFIKGTEVDRKGKQTKAGKVVQTGNRILVTSGDGRTGYGNAKNRFDMDAEVPVPKGTNPLLDLIPYFGKKANPPKTEAQTETADVAADAPDAQNEVTTTEGL